MLESAAIPYEASPLRGERLLVLAPHPDDEVIGCGGLVAQHLRDGRAVRIIIATDGAQAGDAAAREEESRRGIARLGDGAEVEFLRFPDRGLGDDVAARLRGELMAFRPDLIAVPSPIEIHPDHLALARAFCDLVQRDELLFAELAVARVAFYEVSQPLRPNVLVDITDVADAKFAGIDEHRSQTALRNYSSFARGLNSYRAMTLPPETTYAEAYYLLDLATLRTSAFSTLRAMTGAPATIETVREQTPVSVIIRTKDRPALLREAIDSVRASNYPCEIVVVNDGGARVEIDGVTLIEHEQSRGRSVAANEGVRAASNGFIVFLDDDDLHYPEHLPTLTAAATTTHAAWYSDAVSAFLRTAASGAYETHSRQRLYSYDFDRELLLADNYVPLPTLLIPRATFLDLGGFDPEFDLFEDWEFLIRLAQRGDFLHVPRVTCEIRHFEGGSSIILATTGSASPRYSEAKLQVWRKHDVQPATVLAAFERQKRRIAALYSGAIDAKGESAAVHHDVVRLEREKSELLRQLGDVHQSLNGSMLRVRELEGAITALGPIVANATSYAEQKTLEIAGMANEIATLRQINAETGAALELTRVEVNRLTGLLDLIYRSKTWKLHTTLEKIRGRG
ncbi:MAG TPA: PIG-L family deacetylase [Thermoanaerobaculia bacterium]|jgi:LmbE family N-acetylglucosaminyl deacetylase